MLRERLRTNVSDSKMKLKKNSNIFIDLGAKQGEFIYNLVDMNQTNKGTIDAKLQELFKNRSWIIYAVEANPLFDTKLAEMKKRAEHFNHTVNLYTQTVAWTHDGKMDIYFDSENLEKSFLVSKLNRSQVRFFLTKTLTSNFENF
jgi:hypothetical protein